MCSSVQCCIFSYINTYIITYKYIRYYILVCDQQLEDEYTMMMMMIFAYYCCTNELHIIICTICNSSFSARISLILHQYYTRDSGARILWSCTTYITSVLHFGYNLWTVYCFPNCYTSHSQISFMHVFGYFYTYILI